jgi:hypothetical protein
MWETEQDGFMACSLRGGRGVSSFSFTCVAESSVALKNEVIMKRILVAFRNRPHELLTN